MDPRAFQDLDGFEYYVVTTNETPAIFVTVVGLLVALSLALAAPLACCCQEQAERIKLQQQDERASVNDTMDNAMETDDEDKRTSENDLEDMEDSGIFDAPDGNVGDLNLFHQEHLAAIKLVVQEQKANRLKNSLAQGHNRSLNQSALMQSRRDPRDDRVSCVNSVATTSQLHGPASKKRPLRARMPWGHGKPLARSETVQRCVRMERQSLVSADEAGSQSHASRSRQSARGGGGGANQSLLNGRNLSEAAGSFLIEEMVEGEAAFYRQRYLRRTKRSKKYPAQGATGTSSNTLQQRRPSFGASDMGSLMPPLHPDDISPDDAADANDPGRLALPLQYGETRYTSDTAPSSSSTEASNTLSAHLLNVIDLADPDFETKRLLTLAIPTTIGAMADPMFRILLVAILSHFVNTDSMVAYLLVMLFIRLTTEELSGAISDAENNMVQDALMQGGDLGFFQAGQAVQLAVTVQLLVSVPVLLIWFFIMDDVVEWLVSDSSIAAIAASYTGVIMIDYVLRGVSRSFMLPLYLTGQAQFESHIDVCATVLTMVAIAVVATTNDLTLASIGWIQVITGFAKAVTKLSYVTAKGWMIPYKAGFLNGFAIKNTFALKVFLLQAFPLFLGSLLELGEWEVLVLFVSHLGAAEVATWAIMGVIWELFVALTEGLGEAASVRVSVYLTDGLPVEAKRLAQKVAFMTCVLNLIITSLFLIVGPNIAVALSTDNTIQHLLSELVGLAGLANVAMTFAQVYWSIAGAQGRFSFASASILICRWFIILPMGCICIFNYNYDLIALAGSVAVGYAIAALALAIYVFRSDWLLLADALREDAAEEMDPAFFDEEDFEDESSEESSSEAESEQEFSTSVDEEDESWA